MRKLAFVAIAFVAFGSTAHAMGGGPDRWVAVEPNLKGRGPFQSVRCVAKFPAGMTQAQVNAITEAMGPTNTSCLVRSPADCAPQGAEIVWGPRQEMVGFSCYSNANGG
jgi:hypothetical protein